MTPNLPADDEGPPARAGGSGRRAAAALLLPGLAAVAVFLLWELAEGGFAPIRWYPGALFFLALFAVVAVVYPSAWRNLPRAIVAAVALFAGFAAWSFLSIAWADVKGDAWDGANRTLLYVTIYALFAILPWRAAPAAVLLGTFSVGTAAVGGATFLDALAADDAHSFFIDGRFSDPVGYPNANCALWLVAFWPAVVLASRREVPSALRGLALAAAGLLVQLAILPQSRGSLVAFPIVLAASLLLVPGRLRFLLALAAIAAATLAAIDPLLDVYDASGSADGLHDALERAGVALGASVAGLFLLGTLIGLVDRHVTLPARAVRLTGRAVALAGVGAAVVGIVLAVSAIGSPTRWLGDRWDEFTTGTPAFESGRFGVNLGSNRYDFWRVALGAFADSPVGGIGAENFAVDYVRERRSYEEPRYAHSLEIGIVSQTGVVGTFLAAGFLGFALVAAGRARRLADPLAQAVGAGALLSFSYWFVHGSADWFWEFPALAGPALACLGLAAGLVRGEVDQPPAGAGGWGRIVIAGGALAALLAAGSLALPWLAAREVDQAGRTWRHDAAGAYDRLERARGLNPLSARPDLIAGAIASRLGDRERMREAFGRAAERSPKSWYAHLELGLVEALDGERDAALRELERARALNPREPVIELVSSQVRAGEPVSPRAVDRLFLQRVEEISN
jgi:tetratricopeptide (TPR) repeat protein